MIKRDSIITIIGGSGFLGSYVIKEIAKTGSRIKVVSRHASSVINLKISGAVGQITLIDCDAKDQKLLEQVIKGSTYVINLIGVLYSGVKQDFETLHHKNAEFVAKTCNKYGVQRLIHISALGCDRALTSKYANTKLLGEKAILKNFPKATILRPSVMFGHEDNFINFFNLLARFSPVLPLIGGGKTNLQPVYVADVAKAIFKCLDFDGDKYEGHIYELGGPEVLTMKDTLLYILKITNRHRLLIPLPFTLAKFQALFLELLPKPLLSRDQVELLKYDSITSGKNGLEEFDIIPTPMGTVVPKYIK